MSQLTSLPPIELLHGSDSEALGRFVAARIYEFNTLATGYFDAEDWAASQKDESGAIVAGICGFTWGGACYVSYLWVSEDIRRHGVGRALLTAAEDNALAKGCSIVVLSTHSFQAPGFYERMGYEAKAVITDYPVGYSDTFYVKRLAAAAGHNS